MKERNEATSAKQAGKRPAPRRAAGNQTEMRAKERNASVPDEQTRKRATPRRAAGESQDQAASPTSTGGVSLPADERRRLIAESAYYRAHARGFTPGEEMNDWLLAEAEVDDRLLRG